MNPDGGWQIGPDHWTENPLIAVPASIHAAVNLWLVCRAASAPMGPRALPCAGAVGDQPAGLMQAFDLLDLFVTESHNGPAV